MRLQNTRMTENKIRLKVFSKQFRLLNRNLNKLLIQSGNFTYKISFINVSQKCVISKLLETNIYKLDILQVRKYCI
jgi:hypothetical protein